MIGIAGAGTGLARESITINAGNRDSSTQMTAAIRWPARLGRRLNFAAAGRAAVDVAEAIAYFASPASSSDRQRHSCLRPKAMIGA